MEPWLVCRVILYAHRRRRALAAVRMWTALEPGTRAALLLRNGDGAVFQVGGLVRRSAAGEGHSRVEVQIPWDADLSLAAWARKAVKEGDTAVLHGYVAQVRDTALSPLKLVYDGYAVLRGSFIYKVLDADAGRYLLELLLGSGSLLIPLKYYKYERKDRGAGGDAGVFQLPLDAVRTLRNWGVYDPDADAVRLRMRVWAPQALG